MQTKASHQIVDEQDGMNLMTAEYNLERVKLEASKAEVVSDIEGAKSRIDVGISRRRAEAWSRPSIGAHKTTQEADLERLQQRKDKTVRDVDRAKGYLSKMVLRAPQDGIVNILPNFRAQGSFGSAPPPFKEGDRAWTGAAIAEIPDLSHMRIELKLDEVDRGQSAARPERQGSCGRDRRPRAEGANSTGSARSRPLSFAAWASSEKTFPARATLKELDPRLRPGMSATAEIVIESEPNTLLIPVRASFMHQGKPAVYVQQGKNFVIRPIEVGKRNDTDMVVTKGLREGEIVALENPIEAAQRARRSCRRRECDEKDSHSADRAGVFWPALVCGGYAVFKSMPQRQCRSPPPRFVRAMWSFAPSARGELRAVRSATLIAPNLFGTVQVTQLASLGSLAREKDLIVEFDDAEVLSRIEEKQLELDQIDEQIKKAQADLAIRNNQDQVELLRARYAVRRAELEVKRNELLPAIDQRKNELNLEEARRRLKQLESDIKSRQEQAQAEMAVLSGAQAQSAAWR